jgi:predicted transcriptional regulator
MKTATLPSLRVDPQLRDAAQSVLQEGETLSGFIEASVRETIERRLARSAFVERGLVSREEAQTSGVYFAAEEVHAELGQMLRKAQGQLQKRVKG